MPVVNAAGQGARSLDSLTFPELPSSSSSSSHAVSHRVIESLDASDNRITSLRCRPEVASNTRQLILRQNRLSSWSGVEQWHDLRLLDVSNSEVPLVSVDAERLGQLSLLAVLRCESCGIQWCELNGVGERTRNASAFQNLRTLLLSHNLLESLPCVQSCHFLTTLDVSHNRISSLDDVDAKLPPSSLEHLYIDYNELDGSITSLTPLAFLAEHLADLRVSDGNPDSTAALRNNRAGPSRLRQRDRAGGETTETDSDVLRLATYRRVLLSFLLPVVEAIDSVHVSALEREVASTLFRLSRTGPLDGDMLQLMEPANEAQLLRYLERMCHKLLPSSSKVFFTTAARSSNAAVATTAAAPSAGVDVNEDRSLTVIEHSTRAVGLDMTNVTSSGGFGNGGGERPMVPLPYRGVSGGTSSSTAARYAATTTTPGHAPSSVAVEEIVIALQTKLKLVEDVVRDLYRVRRVSVVRAVVAIQKYIRGYLLRRSLPRAVRQQLAAAAARRRRRVGVVASAQPPTVPAAVVDDDVVRRVKAMDGLLRQLWGDTNHLKRFLFVQHAKAARLIQAHYRGYVARKRWKVMRAAYVTFQNQFLPFVRRLQEVGRRYLVRKSIYRRLAPQQQVRSLQSEVASLRDVVRGLQTSVQLLLRERRSASLSTAAAAASAAAAAAAAGGDAAGF